MEQETDLVYNARNTFNALKCGLYSKSLATCKACSQLLIALFEELQPRSIIEGNLIYNEFINWFLHPGTLEANGGRAPSEHIEIPLSLMKLPKRKGEIAVLLNESGLRTVMRSLHYHSTPFIEQFVDLLATLSRDRNSSNLLVSNTRHEFSRDEDYLDFLLTYMAKFYWATNGHMVMGETEAMRTLLDRSLLATSEFQDPSISLDQKIGSLVLLVEIWELAPALVAAKQEGLELPFTECILKTLKRGC